MRRLVLKLALVVIAGLLPVVTTTVHAAAATDPASDFVARINDLRASKGLRPLTPEPALTSFAAGWTAHMAQTGQLAHNPALTSAPGPWTVVGENVGVGGDTASLFRAFVASPHHYENLVDPRFTVVGVSVTVDANGRMWTTHDFEALGAGAATPASAPAPVRRTPPTTAASPRPAPATTARPVAPAPSPPAPVATAPGPQPVDPAIAPPAAAPSPHPPPPVAPARIKLSLELLRGSDPSL